ncbi:hypothetical protein Rhe02_08350 [Rhizocola hellebori]|uniref:CU044_5270 family protein n=1 Tax=Rhizocola hellebori TaxID=1392758 RepID=A0A8J3Q3P0_9ACTN|nr:CU044_5270 family protein [Rhizocola hellebori]GIH02768.1 hypothetical protein Rhe02_08350 [Rhizocola hellebori]
MDELEQLARARPVAPPSAQTIARSRAALIQLAGGRPARNRRVMNLRARILVPVAATVLAVATGVAVTMLKGGTGAPNASPSASPSMPAAARAWDSANAPQLLLVAAEQAQQEEAPGTGTYWVSTIEHGWLIPTGAGNNQYTLRLRRTEITWKPLVPGKDVVHISRWAGAEPLSDGDKAAWRAAGSPTSWPIEPPPGCPPDPRNVYTAEPGGSERVERSAPDARLFMIANGESLTAEQIRALPSDPVALRTWLLSVIDPRDLRNPVETGKSLFEALVDLVLNTPITPAVRSAAFRVLAGVPGIRSLGAVTDAKGRSGVAVSIERNDTVQERRADPGGPREVSLVLDPNTGAVLGRQVRALRPADYLSWVPAGAIQQYDLIEHLRWTNDEPPATPRITDEPPATPTPGGQPTTAC